MEVNFAHFVTVGLFLILLSLSIKIYWNIKRKITGFPFFNILPYIVYCYATGKITKNTPVNNVAFEKLIDLGRQYSKEGLFMTYLSRPVLFIYSGEAIKIFANHKASMDKSPEYKILEDPLGGGILISNGKKWKSHRKLINPVFQMRILREKIPLFNEHAMSLVKEMEKLAGKPSADLLNHLKINYFSALCESVMGLKQSNENKLQFKRIMEYVDTICAVNAQRILCPWLHWKYVMKLLPTGREYYQQIKRCDDYVISTISDMKDCLFNNKCNGIEHFGNNLQKSFTYILLNHHLNNPSAFTFEDLQHEVKTILVTGYDTVTYSTMWCLFLLGLHPEIQEKVFREIQSIASDYITYEESNKLTYLEAVIMESSRLYPTVSLFARNLSEDIEFGKHKVYRGTTIFFFSYLSHRDPKVFPDPEIFKPERFLNEELKRTCEFIPFSEGSRNCVGKMYGIMEMKIFLAHILRNFQITSLSRREDIKLCWTIITSPLTHLRFKITQRQTTSV